MNNLFKAISTLIICALFVLPLLWWIEADFKNISTNVSPTNLNKEFNLKNKTESNSKLELKKVLGQRGLVLGDGVVFNSSASVAVFFAKIVEGEKGIFFWEDGYGVSRLVEGEFLGSWGIYLSDILERIVLTPLSEEAELRGNNACSAKNGEQITIVRNKVEKNREGVEGLKLTFSLICSASGNSDVLMQGEHSVAKILTFSEESSRIYWRSYSLDGLDSVKRVPSIGEGLKQVWHFGDISTVPVPGDYNGDGLLDLATFKPDFVPQQSFYTKNWYIALSGSPELGSKRYLPAFRKGLIDAYWGHTNSKAVPGDYDGDGAIDIAVYFPEQGVWQALLSSGNFNQVKAMLGAEESIISSTLGGPKSIPVVGDYNGDSCSDFAVVKNTEESKYLWSVYHLRCKESVQDSAIEFQFGVAGDIPVPGDYNGDGRVDAAVYSLTSKQWRIRYQLESGVSIETVDLTLKDAKPFLLDLDADGLPELGLYSSDPSLEYSYYFFNRKFSKPTQEVMEGRLPVLTKIKRSLIKETPVQILLQEHQRRSIDEVFIGKLK